MPLDHDQRPGAARQLDRGSLLVRQPPTSSGKLLIESVYLAGGRRCGKRVEPGGGESVGDRDDGPFAAAVLAGGAGPVGEDEDILGCPQLAELLKGVIDWGAGGLFERDRAGVASGERRIEFRQRVEYVVRPGRGQRWLLLVAEQR